MTVRTLIGDCRTILPTLPDNSVQCVVTSPPYYGLRDYGTAQWEGGDAGCDHVAPPGGGRNSSGLNSRGGQAQLDYVAKLDERNHYRDVCGRCGARRIDAQIGLEPTPEAYLATMVGVFREVRRILRPDGVMFLNIGDSYAGGNTVGWRPGNPDKNGGNSNRDGVGAVAGCKPKDLLMMPARLALALQADGWWLRSDIIWHKPNPMPESVTDRPVSSHEHVFLLTKRSRYFYDADAVREEAEYGFRPTRGGNIFDRVGSLCSAPVKTPGCVTHGGDPASGRSCRNVWTIATHAFSAAHFATFPPALVERCIRAGTSERGCCAACGKPWVRITDTSYTDAMRGMVGNQRKTVTDERVMHAGREQDKRLDKHVTTTGWAAGCACGAGDPVPCTILDPFSGAGTSLLVADRLQRNAIGIELNPAYTQMSNSRIVDDCPLFSSWPPADDPADERMAFDAEQRDLFSMAAD